MAQQVERQGPGGRSTICLGLSEAEVVRAAGSKTGTSSNAFAHGSNQNSGNFITDRPSTGLHAPPGGKSTICLGTDVQDWKASSQSKSVSTKAMPVEVAVERGHSRSTVCLGTDAQDWKPTSSAFDSKAAGDSMERGSGRSTVCLGTDAQDWKASSRAFAGAALLPTDAVEQIRAPPGGRSTLILGAGPEQKASAVVIAAATSAPAASPVKADVVMASPTKPARLDEMMEQSGSFADDQDEQMPSPTKKTRCEASEPSPLETVKDLAPVLAAGQRRQDLAPTPARAADRAPPGGKATLLLG